MSDEGRKGMDERVLAFIREQNRSGVEPRFAQIFATEPGARYGTVSQALQRLRRAGRAAHSSTRWRVTEPSEWRPTLDPWRVAMSKALLRLVNASNRIDKNNIDLDVIERQAKALDA